MNQTLTETNQIYCFLEEEEEEEKKSHRNLQGLDRLLLSNVSSFSLKMQ